jgi:Recombination endonuclease VII
MSDQGTLFDGVSNTPRKRFKCAMSDAARKKADAESKRRYRMEHPEKVRASRRKWNAQNRRKLAAKMQNWRNANRDKVRAQARARYQANRAEVCAQQRDYMRTPAGRDKRLRHMYGISFAEYQRMLTEQGGVCAICLNPFGDEKSKRPHVDHDHGTRGVRGLLCNGCNSGIGQFGDDVARLRAALDYLQRFKTA